MADVTRAQALAASEFAHMYDQADHINEISGNIVTLFAELKRYVEEFGESKKVIELLGFKEYEAHDIAYALQLCGSKSTDDYCSPSYHLMEAMRCARRALIEVENVANLPS